MLNTIEAFEAAGKRVEIKRDVTTKTEYKWAVTVNGRVARYCTSQSEARRRAKQIAADL